MSTQPRTGPGPSSTFSKRTTAKAVASELRNEIYRGQIPPGTRLMQADIAERFGVSTTPVREAFAMLQADGLVRLDSHRGAIVFQPTAKELLELFEIRELLEGFAAEKAADNMSDETCAHLEHLLEVMSATEDRDARHEPHREFHRILFEVAGRPRLSRMIVGLLMATSPFVLAIRATRDQKDEDADHREMIAACRERDGTKLAELTRRHLQLAAEGAVAYLSPTARPA
jgi:DNA-binding GntR family transcriptional regulator